MSTKDKSQLQYGEGSFYYSAKRGMWVGTLEAGQTPSGKRRRFTVSAKDEDTAWAKFQNLRERHAPTLNTDSHPFTTGGRPRHEYKADAGPMGTTVYQDNLDRLEAQGGLCFYCSRSLSQGWVMDHKIPLSRGGTNAQDNLVLCCAKCNNTKGRKTEEEFLAWAADNGYFQSLPLTVDAESVGNTPRRAAMARAVSKQASPREAKSPKRSHRLPEGQGAFYYAPSQDRWIGVIEAGWNAQGKRRRLTVSSKNEDEAWQKLQAKRKQILIEGLPSEDVNTSMPVGKWCAEYLQVRKRELKPKPWGSEKSAVQKWIVPTLGHRKLEDVSARDVRLLGDAVAAVNSETHARYVQRIFQQYLRGAVMEGYRVPTVALEARKRSANVSPREALPLADVVAFLQVAHESPDHSRWDAAFLQGLRQGEALGLRWEDVDLQHGTLAVRWTLQEVVKSADGGYMVPSKYRALQLDGRFWLLEPKSRAAQRMLPLVPQFRRSLEEWREVAPPSPHGLVWPRPNGLPKIAGVDRREFREIQGRAGISKPGGGLFTVHEARHSTVSILLELGVPREVIEAIVGHSELVESYISVDDARVADALGRLGGVLGLPN